MILPDGSEVPVFRPWRSNVIEQKRVVRAAVAHQAQALVIECMALQPALQSLCELKLVQATHGVITNARADHLDVMGPTVVDVAQALAGSTPVRGRMYTAEQRHLEVFENAARDRTSHLTAIGDDDVAAVSWDELAAFRHIEHPDNVALALRVCTDLGVDRGTALRGMWGAPGDPGVMSVYRCDEKQREILFVNGFAANDPESTGNNWNMLVDRFHGVERRIAMFNCRADRAERSVQLADACVRWKPADHYVVIGTATEVFARRAMSQGLSRDRITCAEQKHAPELVELLSRQTGRSAFVMGMGNISGPGMEMVDYFRSRNVATDSRTFELQEAA
jgi:poly-gamma-glutamate synthase PgsB/CapB